MTQTLFPCPQCRSGSLVSKEGGVCCPNCGFFAEGSQGAHRWAEAFSNPPGKTYTCPACRREALVDAGRNQKVKSVPRFACFACGNTWQEGELALCPECGQPAPAGDFEELIICRSAVGFYVCKDCYAKIR